MLTEDTFLTKMAVDMYNDQFKTKFKPEEFCIASIPNDEGYKYGYEFTTYDTDDYLRLRVYFDLARRTAFTPYSIKVTYPALADILGDEVFVCSGHLESYWYDTGAHKYLPINTCGENYLITEASEIFETEDGFLLLAE